MQSKSYINRACRTRFGSGYSVNIIGVFVEHFQTEMRESAAVYFVTYVYAEFLIRPEPFAIRKSAYRRIIFRAASVYEIRSGYIQTLVVSYRAVSRSLQEYTRILRSAADRIYSVLVHEQTYVGDILSLKFKLERIAYFIFAQALVIVSSAVTYYFSAFLLFGYRGGL